MAISRSITISKKNKIIIKQTEEERYLLSYDNIDIVFSKGAFYNFLIEMDGWGERKKKESQLTLNITTNRAVVKIKSEDVEDFIFVVNEVSYEIVPILKLCKEILFSNELFKIN